MDRSWTKNRETLLEFGGSFFNYYLEQLSSESSDSDVHEKSQHITDVQHSCTSLKPAY